jgi:hypothetical protein
MTSPSIAAAGNGPHAVRILGRTDFVSGDICITMKIAA